MANSQQTSTLLASERQFRSLSLGITYGCLALSALTLVLAHKAPPALWVPCALICMAGHLSNLNYLRTHEMPTIGLIPPALFSLLPALIALLAVRELPELVRVLVGILVLVLSVAFALFVIWFCRLRLAYRMHPTMADDAALIVLGGAIRKGRPALTLSRRLDTAARLWHDCPQRTIVVTGGPIPSGTDTEADAMARYLREQRVPASSILRERAARNTRENIEFACALLNERGHTSQICVVSSDYHLWRALREARRVGQQLTPVAAPTPAASVPQQWSREVLTNLFGR